MSRTSNAVQPECILKNAARAGARMDTRPVTRAEAPLHSEALPESVQCPFCGGAETEQFSTFGGQASTSQYYCRPCRSVFEYLRWR